MQSYTQVVVVNQSINQAINQEIKKSRNQDIKQSIVNSFGTNQLINSVL